MRTIQATTKSAIVPEQRAQPPEGEPVGVDRSDRPSAVDLEERACGRRLDEPEPEQRSASPRPRARGTRRSRPPGPSPSREVDAPEEQELQQGDHDRDRDHQSAEADEQAEPARVHARRGREDLAPGAPPPGPKRRGADATSPAPRRRRRARECSEHQDVADGLRSRRMSPFEPFATPLQNRSVAPVPKTPPAGTA